jgi:hypothetical protein
MGRIDVDRLRDELTPEQMAGWLAYWKLEPWGEDWKRSAVMTAALLNTIHAAVAAMSGGTMREADQITADDLLGRGPATIGGAGHIDELAIARQMAGV